ncbi:MAG: hypothetical protein JRE73_11750 [Deltaproteobacteria bacterium]|nr:hypothetical protein [Deltaproteobacteria bacterium]
MLRQPLERDFGFAPATRRLLNRAKPLPVLRPHRRVELRPVRAQQAAEPPNRDPEIMERLAVGRIIEPTLSSARGRNTLQRQPSRSFLVAAKQKIVRQRTAALRFRSLGQGLRPLRVLWSVRHSNDRCRISSFASDSSAPA